MPETIYNLYAYTDETEITELGVRYYQIVDDPSDEVKIAFLRERAQIDHPEAQKYRFRDAKISLEQYRRKERLGTTIDLFEPIFEALNASRTPLYVITMIVNGEPKINHVYTERFHPSEVGIADDYLEMYEQDGHFHFARMLEDDYFRAIKLLFNERLFVSGTKLLVSFLDTIAFIEYGDSPGVFCKWLNTFVDLKKLNITAEELWELRNGLLHMTNLNSRKVAQRRVRRLVPGINIGLAPSDELKTDEKPIDLWQLILEIKAGLEKWLTTYNNDPSKIEMFVERYDTIVSDTGRQLKNSETAIELLNV